MSDNLQKTLQPETEILKESVLSLKENIQILDELIEREKDKVLKLKQVKDLVNKRESLINKLEYYEECLNYENEKSSFNKIPLQINDKLRNCVCFYNSSWTTGRIMTVNEDFTVEVMLNGYYNSENNQNLQVKMEYKYVKPNKFYSHTDKDLFKGMNLEAIYRLDGEYYKAEVINISKDYIEVLYLGYETIERLDYDMIRLVPSYKIENLKKKQEKDKEKLRKQDEDKEELRFIVPDSLKVTINDGEDERKLKKKKVNALKLSHKEKVFELVSNKKKENWLDFQVGFRGRKRK